MLPSAFNKLRKTTGSIAIVISPLVALMKEQVQILTVKGVKAVYTGDLKNDDRKE